MIDLLGILAAVLASAILILTAKLILLAFPQMDAWAERDEDDPYPGGM